MTFLAIDNNGFGCYIEAADFAEAESICACNRLFLIGEVIVVIEQPGLN